MAKLNETIRRFIVMELACYKTPSEVAESVGEQFGVEITRMQAYDYDPTGAKGRRVGKKLVKLFEETRERFKAEIEDIPIANKAFRLRRLDELHRKAIRQKNYPLAGQLMEQAAKECGDAYTNKYKLEHGGRDGKDLPAPEMHVHCHQVADGSVASPEAE